MGEWSGGGAGGAVNQEYVINIFTLLYTKKVNHKDLQYNTGNYTQYLIITFNEKESNMYVLVGITESLWCTRETNTTL